MVDTVHRDLCCIRCRQPMLKHCDGDGHLEVDQYTKRCPRMVGQLPKGIIPNSDGARVSSRAPAGDGG